tara:strand:- start:754 stop:1098 length:345 start_codon:yes stop_codon:yes gene_type:complete
MRVLLLVFTVLLYIGKASELFNPHFKPHCNCIDKVSLGRSTWKLLHDIVNSVEREKTPYFVSMMDNLGKIYPCEECRLHISEYIQEHPTEMTHEWLCTFHNAVNQRLNKKKFKC